MLHVLTKAIPLMVGLSEEGQVITVPLVENFIEQKVKTALPIARIWDRTYQLAVLRLALCPRSLYLFQSHVFRCMMHNYWWWPISVD